VGGWEMGGVGDRVGGGRERGEVTAMIHPQIGTTCLLFFPTIFLLMVFFRTLS
jgi:hypothetical protein